MKDRWAARVKNQNLNHPALWALLPGGLGEDEWENRLVAAELQEQEPKLVSNSYAPPTEKSVFGPPHPPPAGTPP